MDVCPSNFQGMAHPDSFGARSEFTVGDEKFEIFRLDALQQKFDVARLPYCLKVLLENLLRNEDGEFVTAEQIEQIAKWDAGAEKRRPEIRSIVDQLSPKVTSAKACGTGLVAAAAVFLCSSRHFSWQTMCRTTGLNMGLPPV